MDYLDKFYILWLSPYHIWKVFDNNSLKLETLNGKVFSTRISQNECKEYKI